MSRWDLRDQHTTQKHKFLEARSVLLAGLHRCCLAISSRRYDTFTPLALLSTSLGAYPLKTAICVTTLSCCPYRLHSPPTAVNKPMMSTVGDVVDEGLGEDFEETPWVPPTVKRVSWHSVGRLFECRCLRGRTAHTSPTDIDHHVFMPQNTTCRTKVHPTRESFAHIFCIQAQDNRSQTIYRGGKSSIWDTRLHELEDMGIGVSLYFQFLKVM